MGMKPRTKGSTKAVQGTAAKKGVRKSRPKIMWAATGVGPKPCSLCPGQGTRGMLNHKTHQHAVMCEECIQIMEAGLQWEKGGKEEWEEDQSMAKQSGSARR